MKQLNITHSEDLSSDVKTFGDPNAWQLVCKAWSDEGNWMKSTKAMNVPGGCLVQVSTEIDSVPAEAITFVPGVVVIGVEAEDSTEGDYFKVTKRELVPISG